ncbi:MAG: hypothetical protein Fur005_47860 [Roseiflexaceae bacterium]
MDTNPPHEPQQKPIAVLQPRVAGQRAAFVRALAQVALAVAARQAACVEAQEELA